MCIATCLEQALASQLVDSLLYMKVCIRPPARPRCVGHQLESAWPPRLAPPVKDQGKNGNGR